MSGVDHDFLAERVVSADGTTIVCRVIGSGPAVVVVPGAFRMAVHYERLARCLAEHFTVHVMDRRGRGGSGAQGPAYGLDREREDVEAVLALSRASLLFGHSYGGLVGLEVARARPLAKLALYEPSVSVRGSIDFPWLPAYDMALACGDSVAALGIFFAGMGVDFPEEFRKELPRSLEWPDIAGLLPTVANECREVLRADSTHRRYGNVTAETLLMNGAANGEGERALNDVVARALASVMPHLKTVSLPGLDHNAPDVGAPEQVARRLAEFFA